MELKLSGEASQTYLVLPSTEVCIRTLTVAEVSIKIRTCSQIPGGLTAKETWGPSHLPSSWSKVHYCGGVHSATQLSIICSSWRSLALLLSQQWKNAFDF